MFEAIILFLYGYRKRIAEGFVQDIIETTLCVT